MSLGWVKKKPGSRVDVVVGGKGGGKGERRGGEEWKPGQRWERRDLVTWVHSQQSQFEVRNSRVAKKCHVRQIRQHPFQPLHHHHIMVSPPVCASACLITFSAEQ